MEERNKWFEEGVPFSEMGSRWDSMELKKGSVPVPVIEMLDSEVSRKWVEFETLSARDMSAQGLIGDQAYRSSTSEGSQSLVSSQTYQLNPEEAKPSFTSSQTDISNSNGFYQSINGVQNTQTNTAEALKKEVRRIKN